MPSTSPTPPLRLHGLDTLRAAAILAVMLYHLKIQGLLPTAWVPFAAIGWIGVDLFFVLSGFLIGSQLLRSWRNGETPSLKDFYARRAYRILPVYLAVLLLYSAVPLWREAPGPSALWQYLLFLWNLTLLHYPEQRAFSHVWSLCVEEHFYLLLPLLLLLFMRRPSVTKTVSILLAIFLGGIVLRAWLLHHVVLSANDDQHGLRMMKFLYYPTYTRLDGLVTGVTLALIRTFRLAWWTRFAQHGDLLALCGLALIAAALRLCAFNFPDPDLPASILFAFPALALGFGLLVVSATSDRGLLRRKVPGATTLATLAFSLYLTHKSVAHATHLLLPSLTAEPNWRSATIYLVACLAVAALLYIAVERPFLQLRSRRARERSLAPVDLEGRFDPAL